LRLRWRASALRPRLRSRVTTALTSRLRRARALRFRLRRRASALRPRLRPLGVVTVL